MVKAKKSWAKKKRHRFTINKPAIKSSFTFFTFEYLLLSLTRLVAVVSGAYLILWGQVIVAHGTSRYQHIGNITSAHLYLWI